MLPIHAEPRQMPGLCFSRFAKRPPKHMPPVPRNMCQERSHCPDRKNLDRPIPHAHMSKRPQDGCHRLNHTLSGPVFPQTLGRSCEGKRKAAVLQNVSFLFWKAVIQCIHNANDFLRKGGYLDAENKNCLYPGSCNGSGRASSGKCCWLA